VRTGANMQKSQQRKWPLKKMVTTIRSGAEKADAEKAYCAEILLSEIVLDESVKKKMWRRRVVYQKLISDHCRFLSVWYDSLYIQFLLKGALNPKFLNLSKNREIFVSRNALVSFINLLLLKCPYKQIEKPFEVKIRTA